jgi:hypothetical protein
MESRAYCYKYFTSLIGSIDLPHELIIEFNKALNQSLSSLSAALIIFSAEVLTMSGLSFTTKGAGSGMIGATPPDSVPGIGPATLPTEVTS